MLTPLPSASTVGVSTTVVKVPSLATETATSTSALVATVIFSSSAATGLSLDIFRQFGTDSYAGLVTSILMGCTETVFYTMSVYFMAAKIKKTRWTLAGALAATAAGVLASIVLARFM